MTGDAILAERGSPAAPRGWRVGGRRAAARVAAAVATGLIVAGASVSLPAPEFPSPAPAPAAAAPGAFQPAPAPDVAPSRATRDVEGVRAGPARPELELGELTAALLPGATREAAMLLDAPRHAIQIDIAPDLRTLTGTQTSRYTNRSDEALTDLALRLLPASPYMGSAMRVTDIAINGELAPVSTLTLTGRDDLAPIVETAALWVALRSPLAPGASLTLSLAYTIAIAENPSAGYRAFGRANGLLALPGAYAAIPVRQSGAWMLPATPGYGDVAFAEAGWFDVEIHAPGDLTVVAPGQCSTTASGPRRSTRCIGGPIREFAATLGRFDVVSQVARLSGGDARVESYATPGRMRGATMAAAMAADALVAYERRFGPYPYRILRVYESPTTVGGMEYSMLAGVTDQLYDAAEAPYFEWIVAHEVAHQWWYGLVGSDPVATPWLDEALTNYSLTYYFEDVRGPTYAKANRERDYYGRYAAALQNYPDLPAGLSTGNYPRGAYGAFVYGKGPIFFDTIRQAAGDEAFLRWLRLYASRFRWGIARESDLLTAADDAGVGPAARAAFRRWIAP